MQIAVASGKGGTGKTTVATSLALSLADSHPVQFLDCDVEAPNGHIFLNPEINRQEPAVIRIPKIDPDRCSLCGKCVEVCQFHALAKVGKTILVFPQLCHGCGSCTWNCPEGAIEEIPNPIGMLESGLSIAGFPFSRGILTISEPMSTPIIRQLKRWESPSKGDTIILDAPPGASCSVVETLRKCDFAILVTEPTPFGFHDLKQMVGIIEEMKIPAGLIINRDQALYQPLEVFCLEHNLPILMRIPYDRRIAEGVARGQTLIDIDPRYQEEFRKMTERVESIIMRSRKHTETTGPKP